jgi:hypothetical protein
LHEQDAHTSRGKILYVDKPLPRDINGELFSSDIEYIAKLKEHEIYFANSLEELQKLLK